jgi:hypothetical protein
MDQVTFAITVLAGLSEILPLLGFTKANGALHGAKVAVMHFHGESQCNVDITVEK